MRLCPSEAPPRATSSPPLDPAPDALARLLGMGLPAFTFARLVVPFYARHLGELVLFTSDNAMVPEGEPRPVYRSTELAALAAAKPSPAELRLIHAAKVLFGGRVSWCPADPPQGPPLF